MIKSADLRLGNLFQVAPSRDVTFQVVELLADGVSACLASQDSDTVKTWESFLYADLFPVPLSDEMLENYGFTDGMLGDLELVPFEHEMPTYVAFFSKTTLCHVQFVHELQNLFYALYNEELSVEG